MKSLLGEMRALLSSLNEGVPPHVRRCVAAVAAKNNGDTGKAFAICVAQGQKSGTLKKGSIEATKAGKKVDRSKAAQKGHSAKMADYEAQLAAARKDEDRVEFLRALLDNRSTTSYGGSVMESVVADTVAQQMGGVRTLKLMLGAQVFAREDGLVVQWPNKQRSRGNRVEITLRSDDTYDMEFFNATKTAKKSVKKYEGVYADQLVELFVTQTGWELRKPQILGL